MADLEDIRRGLAANLATLKSDGFQVVPYLLDNPTAPTIQVGGLTDVDYDQEFRGEYLLVGDKMTVVIEVAIPRKTDIGAQKLLDKLHGSANLKAAVEADNRLQSRMADDGTITISQEPACDDLRVVRYKGSAPMILKQAGGVGMDNLLATWEVEVWT